MRSLDAIRAVRASVAISVLDHVRYVRLTGEEAWEAADRLFTRELYLRDGQISQGLLLNEDGTVFADTYLGSDDEDFFLLLEGPDERGLDQHLARWIGDLEVDATDVTESVAIVGLDGPYAWELLAAMAGPEVIGIPYLTFFRFDGALCYRAGKTGEFGYRLIVPRTELDATVKRFEELGPPFDLRRAGLDELDQCALENWFFNIRREGGEPVTPIELQLQWRVSYTKEYVGSTALARRRAEGITRRLTSLTSGSALEIGDAVLAEGRAIGRVVNAGFSPVLDCGTGLALLETKWAYPHISSLEVGPGAVPATTAAPPLLDNRSLYVNPQLHGYATRLEDELPVP